MKKARNIRRARGPVGLAAGSKGQERSRFERPKWDATGNINVARIYFRTNESTLDQNDCDEIKDLAHHYLAVARDRYITLTFVGRADVRYFEDYNEKPAERCVDEVIRQFWKELKGRKNTSITIHKKIPGEKGMIDRPNHWAECRRVEVWDACVVPTDAPKKALVYTLEDFKDGRLFRVEMFYVPDFNRNWRLWWPFYYYIKDIEEKDYLQEGMKS
jgi:hypothetical protein